MRIFITGGSGAVGRAVVERLAQKGHTLRVIGRRTDIAMPGAEYLPCDIDDFPRLREAMHGFESVVHLASLPNPAKAAPEELFRINCQGTFNVFQAAAEVGIRRVIQASSINTAGQFYGVAPAPLLYLPLDENHPLYTTDIYSYSKNVIESIGEYFWRREGITSLAFRLPWVAPAAVHDTLDQRRERIQRIVDELLEMPPQQRQDWFERAWNSYNLFRTMRPYEKEGRAQQFLQSLPEEQRAALQVMTTRVNFFTMLDERDSAQAVENGLAASFEGCQALYVNDSHNWTGIESRVLIDLFYPDVSETRCELPGYASLVSMDLARRLIGFEPEFTFL